MRRNSSAELQISELQKKRWSERNDVQRVKKMWCKFEKNEKAMVGKGDEERQWMIELKGGITTSEKTEAKQIGKKDLKKHILKPVCCKVASGWDEAGWCGAEGRRGAWSAAKALPASCTNERKWDWCSSGAKSFVLVSARGMVSDRECCCVTTVLREQQAAIVRAWSDLIQIKEGTWLTHS